MARCSGREAFVRHGLTEASVEELDHNHCFICMSTYLSNVTEDFGQTCETPMRLMCGHIIGSACILRWTTVSNTCPMCRYELFQDSPSDTTKRDDDASRYLGLTNLDFPRARFPWAQYVQFVEPEMISDQQELGSGNCGTAIFPSSRVHHSDEETLVALLGMNDEDNVQERLPYHSSLLKGTVLDKTIKYGVMLEKAIADSDILLCELQQFHESWMNESGVEKGGIEDEIDSISFGQCSYIQMEDSRSSNGRELN